MFGNDQIFAFSLDIAKELYDASIGKMLQNLPDENYIGRWYLIFACIQNTKIKCWMVVFLAILLDYWCRYVAGDVPGTHIKKPAADVEVSTSDIDNGWAVDTLAGEVSSNCGHISLDDHRIVRART